MKVLVLVLSILSCYLYSASILAADINCSDGTCSFDPSLDIRNDSSTPEFSQFEVKDLNTDLNIFAPSGSSPRSTKIFISPIDPDGTDLTLSLPSERKLTSAGSAVVIGQSIKNLSVNLNGRPGDGTSSASLVCAEKVLAGDYGTSIKSRFLLARFNDPSLPANRCVPGDLTTIQSNEFTCSPGQTEFNGLSLLGNRWTKRRTCEAQSQRNMCLKRMMRVKCVWTAERFTAGSGSCDENEPNGTSILNPKPRGHGFQGRDWVCDPSLSSTTASGWKLDIDPYIVEENWVQSRRIAGKTDEMICDELTGRNVGYLGTYPDIVMNEYREGAHLFSAIPSMPQADGTVSISRGYWWGKHKKGVIGNPQPHESVPPSTIMISGAFRACFTGGSHDWTHMMLTMNANICQPNFQNNVKQLWTGFAKFGGKGHTYMIPTLEEGLTCYADPPNGRMVCNYGKIGEAYSTSHQFRWLLYGPHGKKFTMFYTKGTGRY